MLDIDTPLVQSHSCLTKIVQNEVTFEWWDEAVAEAIEDGYLPHRAFIMGRLQSPAMLHAAAVEYANEIGA